MTDRQRYVPVRPIKWIVSYEQARKYECEALYEGYHGGTLVGTVMNYGYACYAIFVDERLGACANVESAKQLINHRFDKLSAKPEIRIMLPHVPNILDHLSTLSPQELRRELERRKRDH